MRSSSSAGFSPRVVGRESGSPPAERRRSHRTTLTFETSDGFSRLMGGRDWAGEVMEESGARNAAVEEAHDAAQGAFGMLARYSVMAGREPQGPLARWRRSAIRLVASNASRRLREAARLKALQRTPYPLVLARIKLLLDRLGFFKEQVLSSMAAGPGSRSRRSRKAPAWEGGGAGAGGELAPPDGLLSATSVAVASAIRSLDLSKGSGHLPSSPLDVLARRASRKPAPGQRGNSDDDASPSPSAASPSPAPTARNPRQALVAEIAAAVAVGSGPEVEEALGVGPGTAGALPPLPADEVGGGGRMSLDKLLEELSTTMAYVSDFLRKVPEETRMEACFSAKMENYKKDQTVYRIGDAPERFHLILTGVVEIWTHPPGNRRDKTVIATLKKGQSFGEMAILNDEPRAEVATPTSNCTFLTFQRADLLAVFGEYFRQQLAAAEEFFHDKVSVFSALPKGVTLKTISRMMLSAHPAGKEWEPAADQQVYFIKSGSAVLEALDRRAAAAPQPGPQPPAGTPGAAPAAAPFPAGPGAPPARGAAATPASATAGHPPASPAAGHRGAPGTASSHHHPAAGSHAAPMSSSGMGVGTLGGTMGMMGDAGEGGLGPGSSNEVLAAISIVDGRAVGTLGHEEELRRLRRALIPKKTVASMEAGAHFGGGARILGEGELQACMKVTAVTDMVVYHMHIDQFFKCAAPDLVRALRDDTAFKLTYYFGRQGAIGQDTVIGHADASLVARGLQDEESAAAPTRGAAGPGGRRKKAAKKGHTAGALSSEVERVVAYMAGLAAELDDPGAKQLDLYKDGTPAERFYRSPALCGTARGNALPGLVAGVFGEGLAPLADKVEALAAKALRKLGEGPAVGGPGAGWAAGGGAAGGPGGDPPSAGAIAAAARRMLSIVAPGSGPGSPALSPSHGGRGSPSLPPRPGAAPPSPAPASPARASRLAAGSGAPGAWPAGLASMAGDLSPATARLPSPSRPVTPGTGPGAGAGGGGAQHGAPLSPLGAPGAAEAWWAEGRGGGGHGVAFAARPHTSPRGAAEGGSGGGGSGRHSPRRTGALTAAGFIWQRMRDAGGRAPPAVRQCLTYDEIAAVKAERRRELLAPGERALGAGRQGLGGWVPGRGLSGSGAAGLEGA